MARPRGCARWALAAAALVCGVAVKEAEAVGILDDWGIAPFSGSGTPYQVHMAWQPAGGAAMTTWWKEENNYSPVAYPSVGHVPSPGNAAGERFDFEALYYRKNAGNLQVLIATSIGYKNGSTTLPAVSRYEGGQYWYRLGDLFVNTNAKDGIWDYAVASTDYNDGRSKTNSDRKIQWWAYDFTGNKYLIFDHSDPVGTLYQISYDGRPSDPDGSLLAAGTYDVVSVVDRGASGGGWYNVTTGETMWSFDHRGYGANADLEPILRPWVVNPKGAGVKDMGVLATLDWEYHDYGDRPGGGYLLGTADSTRSENNTWFYQYTIPLSALGLDEGYDLANLAIHITSECGNDMMTSDGSTPPIPEPLSMAGLLAGVGALAGYLRRRRA